MDTFHVIISIFVSCSQSLCVTARSQKFTQEPLGGHHCVIRPDSVVTVRQTQTDQPQWVWKCLHLELCHYINHNHVTGQCDLGLSKCESLTPVVGGGVNVFGPPRDSCVHRGSSQEPGRVIVEIPGQGRLARIKIGDIVLVGKFRIKKEIFWANNEGVRVGPAQNTYEDIEFLTTAPACTLSWIPYKAGELLSAGVTSGGHLSDVSTTYVVKVLHNGVQTFGYYNSWSKLAYYEYGGVRVKISNEILVFF